MWSFDAGMVHDIVDVECALNIGDKPVITSPLSRSILRTHQEWAHAHNCLPGRWRVRRLVSVVVDNFIAKARDGPLVHRTNLIEDRGVPVTGCPEVLDLGDGRRTLLGYRWG